MYNIKRNNWFITDNSLSCSFMDFHANICLVSMKEPCYLITVTDGTFTDGKQNKIMFRTDTLEQAILFCEEIVSNSHTFREVNEKEDNVKTLRRK